MSDKPAKNKGGKPPKPDFTPEQIIQIEALSSVLTKQQLADYFGMALNTLLDKERKDERVSEAYKKGKARAIATVGSKLLNQARDGNLTAMIFYLKTQAGWQETTKVDHTSEDGSMSPGQEPTIEELKEEAKRRGLPASLFDK